jgi:outer membrane protein OmpA-like peptidoglycan-associated protein
MKNILCILIFFPLLTIAQDRYVNSDVVLSNVNHENKTSLLKFTLVDTGINSELSEIGATFFKDKFIIISNKKRRHTNTTTNAITNVINNNIYCTNVDEYGNLSFPLHFSKILDSDFNEGSLTFSNNENTIYFTKTTDESNNFKLFKADLDTEIIGNWKNLTEIKITTEGFSVETPFYSKSNNKLYFSSNMPGGFGGFDIYTADILENGELVNIKNLGKEVNTASDEKYTYVSPNGKYMYFSSNGHDTFGGYDVYRTSFVNEKFVNTINMGSGLNSSKDEIAFMLISETQGYISVNKNESLDDFNIFRFDIQSIKTDLNITIVENLTKTKLPNTDVVITDEFGKEVYNGKSNINGKITLSILPLAAYTITTSKEGYTNDITKIPSSNTSIYNDKFIALTQKKAEIIEDAIVIENIFFDFDKTNIKEESKLSLNKVVEVMNTNLAMTITINAHTDNKGSALYNQKLSEKRAKAAVNYLITKGIDANRLNYKGFGESQLLFKCDVCSDEQNDQNRRIEFKIINK